MNSLRKRVPFVSSSDEREDDLHILDDQEQDEVIEGIRRKSIQSKEDYLLGLRIVVGLSFTLNVVSLFSPLPTPLHAVLPLDPDPNTTTPLPPPIPFYPLLSLTSLLIHVTLFLHLTPALNLTSSTTTFTALPMPFSTIIPRMLFRPHKFLLSCSAPAISLSLVMMMVGRGDWASVVWWSAPAVMVFVVWVVEGWFGDAEEEMRMLERMKYNYRGA